MKTEAPTHTVHCADIPLFMIPRNSGANYDRRAESCREAFAVLKPGKNWKTEINVEVGGYKSTEDAIDAGRELAELIEFFVAGATGRSAYRADDGSWTVVLSNPGYYANIGA